MLVDVNYKRRKIESDQQEVITTTSMDKYNLRPLVEGKFHFSSFHFNKDLEIDPVQ